jgi:hypothetical protein
MDIERTKHNFWFLHYCLLRHVIHPSSVRCRFLMTALPLGGLLVGHLRAIIRQMNLFTTLETPVGVLGTLVFMGVLLDGPWH